MSLSARLISVSLPLLLAACASTSQPAAVESAGFYRVKPGDTLFRIAQNHRVSVANLVRWNGLKDPGSINAGQLLRVSPPAGAAQAPAKRPQPSRPAAKPSASEPSKPAARPVANIKLVWPAKGPIIAKFNGQGSKGIDIAGEAGSPVRAAANGKVTYAGKGIRSYGNLLIIQHDNAHLTVYAHNQSLLVKEGQAVKAGDAIATMGSSGTTRVKLHFELRVRSSAVDPMPYLTD
ncbi:MULTISPECIES: peptidoglycan DD-metalloendopeptidase family protein [Chromobacterium]|uniref:peptidoglycan DD-metalloendopeptidase family protein n=1 Tax=Chromobacterium TaxID=535 RepID=UPI001887ED2E|nr:MULTISPECIES: peptidoglycan DD-metalloendopeptidase family protein [Chromobacterium]QOZ83292.1 LysM peptidoglycan-binding domain-containing protein [Chromobacterium sp. Rain0013]WON83393.1 peptidoglycan DD-metalloendopeptidase family protein [Chromobacterium haemolyticum]